ncbi:MAG: 2,3-bisphosphoglycerate-independent phosphoglycerate mutase [Candidatus Fermentibacteraceae bacterium]
MREGLIESLAEETGSKILLAVMDGLGDITVPGLEGMTPLEAARTPNLDRMAAEGALGQHVPIAHGVTPGSGPAHLALFGYDPVSSCVGRGVLSALGIGFDLQQGDLAARINFCTLDDDGLVSDRRAGRISTEKCRELVGLLQDIEVEGAEVFVRPVKEHRACVVFRGQGLDDRLDDTDPGLVGRPPRDVEAGAPEAEDTASIVRSFIEKAGEILSGLQPANFLLLRGFAVHEPFPSFEERFSLRAGAAALYPMYRGVSALAGMDLLECSTLQEEVEAARKAASEGYTFVFLHHKPTDSSGEDGDAAAKVGAVEGFDEVVPDILRAGFDVICVTGDHSTPCPMKLHSWHPVPLLVHGGPQRTGFSDAFSERQAMAGALGTFPADELMGLLLGSAGKLRKFGA